MTVKGTGGLEQQKDAHGDRNQQNQNKYGNHLLLHLWAAEDGGRVFYLQMEHPFRETMIDL